MKNDDANRLRSLFWETTLRCNAYCEFCGSRCGDYNAEQLKDEVNADVVCKCFSEIAQAYDPKNIMINVTGGEPLLRQDLFDVMTYASKLGFPWGMVTNGSLIDESVVKKLKHSGMKTISISLDGIAQTHNALRRIPDGYEKIKNAVKLLKEADFLDEIQITTVVNHKNIKELEQLYEILTEWEIDSWRIATVDPIGRAQDQKALLLTKEDYIHYFNFFETHQFNGKIILMTSCSHYLGEYDNLYRSHSFSCETGKRIASILANGDIYVCPNVPRIPELIQGNIKNDSFVEVWEKGFNWFRKPDRQKGTKCKKCKLYKSCKGDSLHTWDFSNNEPKVCFNENGYNNLFLEIKDEENLREDLLSYYPKMKGIKITYNNSSKAKLVFTPSATKQLLAYFEWGEKSSRNCFELLAGLVGFKKDKLIVVEHIVAGNLEDRNQVTAAFSNNNYKDLLREVDILNKGRCLSHEKYKLVDSYSLVGIAHTHPLDLLPLLSVPDIELQGQLQQKHKDIVSLIINPQKKTMAAYYNSVFTPIDMELFVKNKQELQDF